MTEPSGPHCYDMSPKYHWLPFHKASTFPGLYKLGILNVCQCMSILGDFVLAQGSFRYALSLDFLQFKLQSIAKNGQPPIPLLWSPNNPIILLSLSVHHDGCVPLSVRNRLVLHQWSSAVQKKTQERSIMLLYYSSLAILLIQPAELVKIRMQLQPKGKEVGPITMLKQVYAKNGFFGLYDGLSAGFLRQCTYTTSRLGTFSCLYDSYLRYTL